MASDWVFALGGTNAGVELLYEHPNCDWKITLSNANNAARFPQSTAADFKGRGIYPLNGCDWWLSPSE
eukprot:11039257-Prorocentrum_lima.AAC.1